MASLLCSPVPVAWGRNTIGISTIGSINRSSNGFLGTHKKLKYSGRSRTPTLSVRAAVSLSEISPNVAAVYGSLLFGGGLFAYAKSSSRGSLLGGLSGGALMGLVFLLSLNSENKDLGEALGFGTALLFVAVFGIRFAATKKIFPAVPLLLMSIVASGVFVGAYLQDRL